MSEITAEKPKTGITVDFYDGADVPDENITYSVIAAIYNGKWIFCRHKERKTYEIPGGHREKGETVEETARRELWEETGALEFRLRFVCVYSVTKGNVTTYGAFYTAQVAELGPLPPDMEMAEIVLADALPDHLTYPDIQPLLFEKARKLS